jgi:hypothetical protein
MKNIKIFFYICVIIIFQSIFSKSVNAQFLDNFTIKKTFDGQSEVSKPASFFAAFPKDEKDYYMLNFAIGYFVNMTNSGNSFLKPLFWKISPVFEYSRNTILKNQQNLFKAGIFSEIQFFSYIKSGWSPKSVTQINYSYDAVKQMKSFFLSEYLSFEFDKGEDYLEYLLPKIRYAIIGNIIKYTYYPSLGFEYSNNFKTKTGLNKGNYGTLMGRILFDIYPFHGTKTIFSDFQFQFDYTYRYNVFDNANINKNYNKFLILSFNQKFSDNPLVEIGIDYTKGDNPVDGKVDMNVWSIELKFGFNINPFQKLNLK